MKSLALRFILISSAVTFSTAHGSTDPHGVGIESEVGANQESTEQEYVIGQIQITSGPVDQLALVDDTDFKIVFAENESVSKTKSDGGEIGKAVRNCKMYPGIASVYGLNQGSGDSSTQKLAAGGRLDTRKYTAAMKPPVRLGSNVTVINKRNGRKINVKVNDRGPYVAGRIIDLTPAAARGLGFSGLAKVEVMVCP